MKIFLNILSLLIIIIGGVWFLQGENVLLGSPMTGQPTWVYLGAAAVVIGLGMLVYANRRMVKRQKP